MSESEVIEMEMGQYQANEERPLFGFWVYLMTDLLLFATLFATYAVLHGNTFGGPSGAELFSPPYVLTETLLLLTSSFTCGIGAVMARSGKKQTSSLLFVATFILGLAFLILEVSEFRHLVSEGNSWTRSGFLSAFFTLVGTHGMHITVGLLWIATLLPKIWKNGFTENNLRRLTMFSMFWHFLDIIWIFIFSIVYMLGVAR